MTRHGQAPGSSAITRQQIELPGLVAPAAVSPAPFTEEGADTDPAHSEHATLARIATAVFFTPNSNVTAATFSPDAERERRILHAILQLLLAAEHDGHTSVAIGEGVTHALPADTAARLATLKLDPETADDVRKRLVEFARPQAAPLPPPWNLVLGSPNQTALLIVARDTQGARLYTARNHALESSVARMLCGRLQAPAVDTAVETRARAFLSRANPSPSNTSPGPSLTPAQIAAAARALTHPLTVITGGPGTGKTTLVRAIIHAAYDAGLLPEDIAVCAPTGKAAHRIKHALSATQETTPAWRAPEPSTLHRLLGYHPGRLDGAEFARHARDPLPHALVIVDEAAMVDLLLMERLLAALLPSTRLVLVGDADQLPPVEKGAVFAQLCALPGPHVARLSRPFRVQPGAAGVPLLACAEAVRTGDFNALASGENPPLVRRTRIVEITGDGAEWLDTEAGETPEAILDSLWRLGGWEETVTSPDALRGFPTWPREPSPNEQSTLKTLCTRLDATRILAVTRGAADRPAPIVGRRELTTDVVTLNAHMQARARRHASKSKPGFQSLPAQPSVFLPGEPVVILRNDYELNLFNGDQGVVVTLAGTDALGVAFVSGQTVRIFSLQRLAHNLTPGYVMTVHRAQGSEFERVCLVLPDRDLPITSRQLIYTALTRARRSLLVIGRAAILSAALARNEHRTSLEFGVQFAQPDQ